MDGNNGNNPLRNGLLIKLQQNVDEILCALAVIHGEIKLIRQENEQRSDVYRKLREKFETHLLDHKENAETMGAVPFLRKLGKKHWRILFVSWVLTQIGIAALVLIFGIGKILQ